MTICVESMFSVPESWNGNGMQYSYAACLPMPVSDEVRIIFINITQIFCLLEQNIMKIILGKPP